MGQDKKVALITGAGRGIGRVIALQLAESGVDIALTDLNPDLEDMRLELEQKGSKCLAFQVDVTDPEAIEEMVNQIVGSEGRIDVLVNNAGITQDNLMMRMKTEQWSKVMCLYIYLCSGFLQVSYSNPGLPGGVGRGCSESNTLVYSHGITTAHS